MVSFLVPFLWVFASRLGVGDVRKRCAVHHRGSLLASVSKNRANTDGAIDELSIRLGRQLTTVEIGLARAAVDNTINELAVRLCAPETSEVDLTQNARMESEQREHACGASLAAASWGSWRMQGPSNARARARHILVDGEYKAVALMKQLTFGANLSKLATEHSLCPSKDNGGELGEFAPGDMAAEFEAFVFDDSTPVGVPVGPVKTPFGYHLLIIDERTTGPAVACVH